MRGLGEGGVGRGEVRGVVVPVEHEVAGNAVEQLRRALLERGARVGDGGQRLVVDLDRLGGVLRLRQRLGDDQRDRLAGMAHLADRERGRGVSLRGEPSLLLSGAWQGTSPSPSAFTSSPVSTSSTPGMPRAAVTSILRMLACAACARTTKACAMLGSAMSSV